MIRIVIAVASIPARDAIAETLRTDPGISIIGGARTGAEALALVQRLQPDLLIMAAALPVLDGLETTKRVMIECPTPIVIVCEDGDAGEVALSMHALRAGALKLSRLPPPAHAPGAAQARADFIATIAAMAQVKLVRRFKTRPPAVSVPATRACPRYRVVAIAASTGGPAALQRLLAELPSDFAIPILVVQHIASGFVGGFATWLNTVTALTVKVAEHGEALVPRTVYVAADECHLGVAADGTVALSRAAPVRGFRPSADHLLESVAQVFGAAAVAVILTGMGQDGTEGLRSVRGNGGCTFVQDEATSVVFGMPRAAMEAGLADAVLPLPAIAPRLIRLAGA